jgi:hypothetical protein
MMLKIDHNVVLACYGREGGDHPIVEDCVAYFVAPEPRQLVFGLEPSTQAFVGHINVYDNAHTSLLYCLSKK